MGCMHDGPVGGYNLASFTSVVGLTHLQIQFKKSLIWVKLVGSLHFLNTKCSLLSISCQCSHKRRHKKRRCCNQLWTRNRKLGLGPLCFEVLIRLLIRWHEITALTKHCLSFSLFSASCCCWYFLFNSGQRTRETEREMPFFFLIPTFSKYLLPVSPTSVDQSGWPSPDPVCPSELSPWPLGLSDPFPASAAPPLPCAAPPVDVSPLLSKRQVKHGFSYSGNVGGGKKHFAKGLKSQLSVSAHIFGAWNSWAQEILQWGKTCQKW